MSVILKAQTEIKVRFNEVDSLRIVWHGHYVKYLEEAREAFGAKYEMGYLDVEKHGFVSPIVKVDIDYKQQLRYGDTVIAEAEYVNTAAAKLMFKYRLYRKSDGVQVAKAKTIQVFLDIKNLELSLNHPAFGIEWKKKWGLIEDS
ncbi:MULTISPECIES: thioesterase family protein [unclassified Lentimicrobium]|uniref:acyl-CoA thioesterase n=1 Tax=unclassified Lentimicrobium TaxID=2677434 RepID=UPI001553D7F0|nr:MULTISPECIES: acyl-CoA thioesterase [unclassified Lentimicrobium]NPD45296.1 acyl-CoA thioesterase [Lentimicrobium sp. S6]NPD84404.1 acyl-CoA thioesterase [Lentimicrobium sp. L6]